MLKKIFNGDPKYWFIFAVSYPAFVYAVYQDTKGQISSGLFSLLMVFIAIFVIAHIHLANRLKTYFGEKIKGKFGELCQKQR